MQNPNTPKNEIDLLTSLIFIVAQYLFSDTLPRKVNSAAIICAILQQWIKTRTRSSRHSISFSHRWPQRTMLRALRVEMREGFANIQAELKDIRLRLDALEVAARNVSGFAKEIDHLLQRVGAIEKHLGIHHNIAA